MNRRSFLKVGALFVPAVAAPAVAYSFLPGDPHAALVGLGSDDHIRYLLRCGPERWNAVLKEQLAEYEKRGWINPGCHRPIVLSIRKVAW